MIKEFNKAMKEAAEQERSAIYELNKEELPKAIKTAFDFYKVLEFLTEKQRTEIFEVVKPKIPSLIVAFKEIPNGLRLCTDPLKLMQVLEFLNAEQRSAVFNLTF